MRDDFELQSIKKSLTLEVTRRLNPTNQLRNV
jgi:hypothetical protein